MGKGFPGDDSVGVDVVGVCIVFALVPLPLGLLLTCLSDLSKVCCNKVLGSGLARMSAESQTSRRKVAAYPEHCTGPRTKMAV